MLNRNSHRSHAGSPALALAIGTVLSFAAAQAVAVQPDVPPDLAATSAQSVSGEGEATYFYRNISKTPELATTKSKLEILTIYVPAMTADDQLIEGAAKVHPLVATYTDQNEVTGVDDIWAAVSRDDGATWKRMNLSHSAERSSIQLDQDGDGAPEDVYGDARKASIKTMGNLVLVSWTSQFCPSGDPTRIEDPLTAEVEPDPFLVKGPQGFVDYGATYDRPDLGVQPFRCVWMARGMVTPADGSITWFAPEQLTSGRRDALQDWPFSAKDAGFAIVWQEDPEGLDPGQAKGPGEGMSGATVNHKTDIWYSYITKADFAKVAVDAEISPDALGEGKPKPAVLFSHPVRLTDNANCKVEDGVIKGLPICEIEKDTYCATTAERYDADGGLVGTFCVTKDGRMLDGDTGASRPNLFMFPKDTNKDGIIDTAEVGLGYEETKGRNGEGKYDVPEDDPLYVYSTGKLFRYHHFPDFTKVAVMQPGNIVNLQAVDPVLEEPMFWPDDTKIYENARRDRFILQAKGGCGAENVSTCTTMVMVYKQGIEGQGRQSDVFMRRAVGGYEFDKIIKDVAINISSPAYLTTVPASNEEGVKVETFDWSEEAMSAESWANPYDDARAQRGVIRGDDLLIGFSQTQNWAAARNGNDRYDFYVRWSKDGGKTFIDPATGIYGVPHNISNLKNNFRTVIEPRTIGTPGSIVQANGSFYSPDDIQNPNVFILAYGTASNVDTNLLPDQEPEDVLPEETDLFFTWTEDAGVTYKTVLNKSTGLPENASLAARNDAFEGEAQLRTTPSGLKLYSVWNHAGPLDGTGPIDGSDVGFRKIENLPDLYDLSGDGVVDLSDMIILRAGMGACEGKKKYNPAMDYDNDRCITLGDYAKWSAADQADDN